MCTYAKIRIFTYAGQYLVAENRMLFHYLVLSVGKLTLFSDYCIIYTYLTYIVKKRRIEYLVAFIITFTHGSRDPVGILCNTKGMPVRVCVLGIHGIYKRCCRLFKQPLGQSLLFHKMGKIRFLRFLQLYVSVVYNSNGSDSKQQTEDTGKIIQCHF